MFSANSIYEGLEEAVEKLAMLKGSCQGIAGAWPDVKVSEAWFEGAARVLHEIEDKVGDAYEFVDGLKDEEAESA
jgi:hypothetical protein